MWIDDECKKLRKRIAELHRFKDIMGIHFDYENAATLVFKYYIQEKNAEKVAERLRMINIKTDKGHSFQNCHVNELLNKKFNELEIDEELYNAVQKIRNMNKRK